MAAGAYYSSRLRSVSSLAWTILAIPLFCMPTFKNVTPPVYELCSRGLRGDCVDLGTVVLGLGTEELYRSAYWG